MCVHVCVCCFKTSQSKSRNTRTHIYTHTPNGKEWFSVITPHDLLCNKKAQSFYPKPGWLWFSGTSHTKITLLSPETIAYIALHCATQSESCALKNKDTLFSPSKWILVTSKRATGLKENANLLPTSLLSQPSEQSELPKRLGWLTCVSIYIIKFLA